MLLNDPFSVQILCCICSFSNGFWSLRPILCFLAFWIVLNIKVAAPFMSALTEYIDYTSHLNCIGILVRNFQNRSCTMVMVYLNFYTFLTWNWFSAILNTIHQATLQCKKTIPSFLTSASFDSFPFFFFQYFVSLKFRQSSRFQLFKNTRNFYFRFKFVVCLYI